MTPGPPPGYYSAATGLGGRALREALSTIIAGHTRLSQTGLWSVVTLADSHGADRVLTIYWNSLRAVGIHDADYGWEREHAWPRSYLPSSAPKPGLQACGEAVTDAHHIFAEAPMYNRARSNRAFADCLAGCTSFPVADAPGQYNKTGTQIADGVTLERWEVWPERRGDIARAMFYMDVRYEGATRGGCVSTSSEN